MKSLVLVVMILAASNALAEPSAHIIQKNQGDVLAKLEATNIENSVITNTAVGNAVIADDGDYNVSITQNNVGDVTSELIASNVSNQIIEQNVAGTLAVVNSIGGITVTNGPSGSTVVN